MNKIVEQIRSYFNTIFKNDILIVLIAFLIWKVYLFIVAILAVKYIPLGNTDKFLGGGLLNYSMAPEFFSWANFDGEHYLSIAIYGYKGLEQAFFPLYPALIWLLNQPLQFLNLNPLVTTIISGILISNLFLLLALIFLYKLIMVNYSKRIALWLILILLLFPTSFYFGAVYNESLLLFLIVASFYFAKKKNWFLAGVFGFLASTTKIFGVLLFPALLVEAFSQKEPIKKTFWLLLIPMGLLSYMGYLYLTVNDPIAFYTLQRLVGEQRYSGFTLLPQTFYRYIKMLLSVSANNPIYQTLVLEFIIGIIFFLSPITGFLKKIPLSYTIFAFGGFIIASGQGSFSSVPRYVLILFPSFLVMAILYDKLNKFFQIVVLLSLLIILAIETSLFFRGYWIA